jgi:hypothetical protein
MHCPSKSHRLELIANGPRFAGSSAGCSAPDSDGPTSARRHTGTLTLLHDTPNRPTLPRNRERINMEFGMSLPRR